MIKTTPDSRPMFTLLGLLLFSFLILTPAAFAATVTLSWEAPTTNVDGTPLTDLSGYRIYYGTASRVYDQTIDAGNTTTYRLGNLGSGTTYYLAVTAYDASGIESGYSNEVSFNTTGVGAKASAGVFRDGTWFLDLNGNGQWDGQPTDGKFRFGGLPGDLPVTGDWDGTGTAKIGVYRDGTWFLDLNGNGQWDGQPTDGKFRFGGFAGDIPVTGDWDGTGTAKIGVYRDGTWFLDLNGNGQWDGQPIDGKFRFGGLPGDLPVAGLW